MKTTIRARFHAVVLPWSQEETNRIDDIVTREWDWNWPGWKWAADRLNKDFRNSRTPDACRRKMERLYSGHNASVSSSGDEPEYAPGDC